MTSPAPLRAARRVVTLLFVDLSGYTALCQDLDPEDVHVLVRPLMRALRSTAQELGALVPGIDGDGFLAVLGAEVAHEDDPWRALVAAARLQRTTEEWRARTTAVPLPRLHAGVHCGEVLVAWEDAELVLAGDAVNVASRLCGSAAGGEVLVSDQLADLLPVGAPLGAARLLQVRNRREPVRARALRWAELDDAPAPRAPRHRAPLVDRRAVGVALAALADSSPRGVVVVGEAGVGKTRAVAEWRRGFAGLVVHGEVPRLGGTPLSALATGLRHLVAPDGAPPPEPPSGASLVDALAGLAGDLGAVDRRRLRVLLGEAPETDEQDDLPQLVDAVVGWAAAAAARHPLAVVVEDLHRADPVLLDALVRLAQLPSGPLVVGTARPEGSPLPLPLLPLEPLSPEDGHVLVERLLPGCPAPLAERLTSSSGGNPLYLEEQAQALLDDEAQTAGGLSEAAAVLPTSLRLAVTARLDRLPAAERDVLLVLACLGEAPSPSLVAALLDRPLTEVLARLAALVDRGLLVSAAPSAAFRHGLVQEVVLATASRASQVALHRAAARWDEGKPAVAAARWRAAHLERVVALGLGAASGPDCGDVQAAVAALLALGEIELQVSPSAARQVGDRVEALLSASPHCVSDEERARSALLRGRGALMAGAEADAAELGARAEDLAGAATTRDEARLLRGHALYVLGQHEEARGHLRQARLGAADRGDRSLQARVTAELAYSRAGEDYAGLVDALTSAYAEVLAAGERSLASGLAREAALHLAGQDGDRWERWQRLGEAGLRPDDLLARGWLLASRAFRALAVGDDEAALDPAREAAALGEQLGAAQLAGNARLFAVEAAVRVHAPTALAEARLLLDAAVARGRPFGLVRARALLAAATQRDQGRLPEVPELLSAAAAGCEDGVSSTDVAAVTARLAVEAGRPDAGALRQWRDGARLAGLELELVAADACAARAAALEPGAPVPAASGGRGTTTGWLRDAWGAQAALLSGDRVPVPAPPPANTAETRALLHELHALHAADDDQAAAGLAAAEQEWAALGLTVWRARAAIWLAALAGDATAEQRAREVLDALDAPADLPERFRAQLAAARQAR